MARRLQPHEKDPYALVSTINELVDGRSNNSGTVGNNTSVTLRVSATTTTVFFATCSMASMISLTPRTANAAAALATTYISSTLNGQFVITHANNTQSDRTFDFACVGG